MSVDQLKGLASAKLGFARTNQFLVELPSEFASGGLLATLTSLVTSGSMGGGDLNLLCASATLPGKQVLVQERRIGMEYQKVANGYAIDDVSLTFYVLNDYGIKKYFDKWYSTTVIDDFSVAPYKSEYARDIKIHQLRKPLVNKNFNVGPINIDVGIGQGTPYSVQLIDAFPTTVQAIELNNELDGLVQVTVQLSYTNWKAVNDGQGFFKISAGLPGGLGGIV
ncbi:MAG: hypothetical protein CMK23_07540 [Porticoccaceae bacterium]|nr:hypothetical protein [Porticoccaceae bacterium]